MAFVVIATLPPFLDDHPPPRGGPRGPATPGRKPRGVLHVVDDADHGALDRRLGRNRRGPTHEHEAGRDDHESSFHKSSRSGAVPLSLDGTLYAGSVQSFSSGKSRRAGNGTSLNL